jgi:hypothetical protein
MAPKDEAAIGELWVSVDLRDWREVSGPLQSIEVEDHDTLTDKATIVLDDHTGALAGVHFEGLYVRVALGWQARSASATIFEGQVTGHRVLAQVDGQKIELTALDFTYLMSRHPYEPMEWKVGERPSEVLRRIAGRPDYHLTVQPGNVVPVDDAPLATERARRPAGNLNEWQFVLQEAQRQGCRTFVEFSEKTMTSTFFFVPVQRLAAAEPIGDLRYCRGIGELIQFDYERISSGATPVLSASSTDSATGDQVHQEGPPSPPPPPLPPPDTDRNLSSGQRAAVEALTELSAAAAARAKPPQGRVTGQAGDPKAAAEKLKPDPTRQLGLQGRGTTVGNVQLRAKSRVRITGVAPWAEGEWYLSKVNHVYSRERVNNEYRSSYFSKITATR